MAKSLSAYFSKLFFASLSPNSSFTQGHRVTLKSATVGKNAVEGMLQPFRRGVKVLNGTVIDAEYRVALVSDSPIDVIDIVNPELYQTPIF